MKRPDPPDSDQPDSHPVFPSSAALWEPTLLVRSGLVNTLLTHFDVGTYKRPSCNIPAMAALPIQIDRTSPVPLYHQLAEQLIAAITGGTLRPGDPFENELAMADRLGLSRPTVRRAIAE